MNKVAFLTLISAFSLAAFGSGDDREKTGIMVNIDFQLKDSKKSFQMKNKLILSKENNGWTPLAPSQAGVALLGKLEKPKNGIFMAQFMVVDTSTIPVNVHQMGVTAEIGKPAKVSTLTEDGDSVAITVLSEETTYREK